jgi:hypothetical protein
MFVRAVMSATALVAAGAAVMAEPLNADAARRFVIGKHFAYNCFDGTRGAGHINNDGSVTGTIQFRGAGPVRYAVLPPGTLHVKGGNVCATLRGMPFQPCFNLNKTDSQSFRGSVSGLGFAYCDFTRRFAQSTPIRTSWRKQPAAPLALTASAAASE